MASLAVKYRPKEFEDVVGQESIVKILTRQLELKEFKNTYIFYGASGCGKTTCARAFASQINGSNNGIIEIDAASNNGVDNVKNLVKSASERAIDATYKIIILDEAHAFTSQAWQAFLKCIEEPPAYTIFIFCTTEKNKIPDTIKNRCQIFNFTRIKSDKITERLNYICQNEGIHNYTESTDYIAKISDGSLRTAISNLEKCIDLSDDLSLDNVLYALGSFSYNDFFEIINAIIDGKDSKVLSYIDKLYNDGNDLNLFVEQFIEFCFDLSKYVLFQDCKSIKIPATFMESIINCTNFENASKYYIYIINSLIKLKNELKNNTMIKTTVEYYFLKMSRMEQ